MAVKFKDYYYVLGVSRTANEAEIKQAYRKLARLYHPDVAGTKKGAEDKFKEINEAYEVLSDLTKRKKYDELGPNWKQGVDFRPPPTKTGSRREAEFEFGGTTGFSDFFEQIFGSRRSAAGEAFGRRATTGGVAAERGNDVEGDIMVSLEEAMQGSVRTVSLNRNEVCADCEGSGKWHGGTCGVCNGAGQIAQTETHQVKIPPGITDGQRLRVAGRGQPGNRGGAAGDLLLRVHLASHPAFKVEAQNLIYEAELAPWEAVLGINLSVPTLTEPVNIKIPPGTQNGQKFRIRGRGLSRRGEPQGDLFVVAHLETPKEINAEERNIWEELARISRFNPREK